jgi:hypothetical protein
VLSGNSEKQAQKATKKRKGKKEGSWGFEDL